MASLLGSRAVSPELWWFAFSADINIASAQDRLKYSFVGANQVILHVLQVFLGDTAKSVFVKTSPATGQLYTTTISGLLDSEGETVDDIIAELLPHILPAYPPTGIISLSADGEGWGSKLRASTEYWSKLIGINGIVGAMVYPFTHSIENPADYVLDTAVLGEPVSEFTLRPIVMPPHASEFTSDQTADLVVAIPPSRLLPEFSDLRVRNTTRPGDDTITVIDGVVVFGEVRGWRRYRGMELMIARLGDPEDLIEILPYYPPGANDPNDPNYDPEAPQDGSANPPWWEKPALPDKRPFFPWDTKKPPAVELLVPGDFDPGFAKPCPYAPPDIVIPPVNVLFPEIDIAELELPAGDHTIIARMYNELNEYSETQLELSVSPPVSYPSVVIRGKRLYVTRMTDLVEGFDLLADNQEYPFTQDARDPNCFWIETSSIAVGIHDLRVNYAAGSDAVPLAFRPFTSRSRAIEFVIEDVAGENRRTNPSDNVRIRLKVNDDLPIKGVDFWLKPIVEGGWGTPKVILGSATESEDEEGVFELDTSLSETTKELPSTQFQIGADVTKADNTTSEEPAGLAKPTKHLKPKVNSTYRSPNCKTRPKGQEIDLIVLHHTVGDFKSTINTFMKPDPDNGVSAHFVVDKEGNVYQMVDEEKVAWHAGKNSLYEGSTGVNNRSIGIEIVNKGDGVDSYPPTQVAAVRELVDYLRDKYDITDGEDHVVGHKEVHSGKIDPSKKFPWLEVVPDGLTWNERTTGRKKSKPT